MDQLSRLRAGRGVPRRGVCRMLPAAVLLLAATFAGLSAATSTADAGLRPVRAQARGVDIGPGTLLVAVPGLPDPNFSETVVFIVHHTEDGTMGLVLNRRTDVTVGRLFESIDELRELTLPVFAGGPVARSSAQARVRTPPALHHRPPKLREGHKLKSAETLRPPRAIPDGRHIVGEVHIVNSAEALRRRLADEPGTDHFRLYLGYAGWAPGQLEAELDDGAWHVIEGDAAAVFDRDPDTLWRRVIRRTVVQTVRAAGDTGETAGS